MAGANPLTTTARADLRSVTLTGTGAIFCFDKAVTSIPNPGGFYVGGYRADNFARSTGATPSGMCVTATISGANAQDSFGQVAEGAVRTTGNLGNRADSTALTGSTTHNGTRGLTTAPDLTGVSVVQTVPQQIAFTYDEPVDPSAIVGTAGFHFVTSTGVDIPSDTASISTTDPKTVIAQFPIGGTPVTPLVTDGVRAYSVAGAVSSANDGTLGTYDSQALPSSLGLVTGHPTLVSAVYSRQPGNSSGAPGLAGTLGAVLGTGFGGTGISCGDATTSCVVVDYTFNEGVNLPLATGILQPVLTSITNNYYAYLSDGSFVHPAAVYEPSGTSLLGTLGIGGSTTVRAIFPTASRFDEYLVKAAVTGPTTPLSGAPPVCELTGALTLLGTCAATSSTAPFAPNVTGSQPIGHNEGAFASGFSTAPDAFTASFDTLTNTASVLFDQRVFFSNPANFALLDGNGNAIAGASTASSCPPSTAGYPCPLATGATGPGTYVVYLGYPAPAVQVGNGKALEIRGSLGSVFGGTFPAYGGTVFNATSPTDFGNVQQIVSPAATAAFTHLSASSVKSHKRMTKAYLRHVLAKQLHKQHKAKHHR